MANCLPDLSLTDEGASFNNLLHLGRIIAKFVIFAWFAIFVKFATFQGATFGIQLEYLLNPWLYFCQTHHFCQIHHYVNVSSLQGAPLIILLKFSPALWRFFPIFPIDGCFHYFRHVHHFLHNCHSPRGHFCHPI